MRTNGKLNTKKLTTIAMLSALAYAVMYVGRVPVVLFLKYDPKDVVIIIGGFLFGPLTAFGISAVVSFVEMFTASTTGYIGLIMNILSSCSFACLASLIYKKKRTLSGAVIGLVAGVLFMTAIMLLWNYLITPLYMKVPRETIAGMLIPTFLPYNLLKGGINAGITAILYKHVVRSLRKFGVETSSDGQKPQGGSKRISLGVTLVSCFVVVTCILLVLVLQGKLLA